MAVCVYAQLPAAGAVGPALGAFCTELKPQIIGIPVIREQANTAETFVAGYVTALIADVRHPVVVSTMLA